MKIVVLEWCRHERRKWHSYFRGAGGLWEGHRVEDVATPEAWQKNPELVLQFITSDGKKIRHAQPNKGHTYLAEMEKENMKCSSLPRTLMIFMNVQAVHRSCICMVRS